MMLAIHPRAWYNERADEMICRALGALPAPPGGLARIQQEGVQPHPLFLRQNGKSWSPASSVRPARLSPVKSTRSTNTSVAVRLFPSRSV